MWHLSFLSSLTNAETFASRLEEDCLTVSWFEKDAEAQIWQVEAIFEKPPEREMIQAWIGTLDYGLAPLPSRNWLAENRQSFPVLHIGPFSIYGSHQTPKLPKGKIAFKIDAATAFGTGQHATTHGCLLALYDLKKAGMKVENFLDLGCGTAILAMAMTRLFQVKGIAADNDPEAVARALYNVRENHLEGMIDVVLSEGFANERISREAPYPLIAANILADPLITLSVAMAHYGAKGGSIVLSGLLQTQQEKVIEAYQKAGFLLQETYPMKEWITLVMTKR